MLLAILRASSLLGTLAADHRPGTYPQVDWQVQKFPQHW
jgi:hypothetical protein